MNPVPIGCGLLALGLAPLLWAYVIYPPLVAWLAGRARSGASGEATTSAHAAGSAAPGRHLAPEDAPRVAVLVAAYNEAIHIGERVRNLLAQDYPHDRLQVHVGSDGSSDATASLAQAAAGDDARVFVHAWPRNRGKASVLNELAAQADADILVFTDANTVFAQDTITRLVAAFSDTRLGAVCGELRLQASGGNQDHAYWSIEQRLKAAESSIGGLLGANGGVYAIRRGLYRPLPPDMICDDLVIAMDVAAAGWRTRYSADAVAFELTPEDEASEFHRRVRIGIGNYQALFRRPEYLLRAPWALRFTYFSHKVLRWLTPLWLLLALVGAALLRDEPFVGVLFWLQVAGYALAAIVFATRTLLPWPAALRGGMLFVLLNAAFMVAFVRYVRGDYRGSWRRTVRG